MTKIAALIPELRQLSRQEKWEAMEFLMKELAADEPMPLKAGLTYPVWSPHDSFEAGKTLLDLLEQEKSATVTHA